MRSAKKPTALSAATASITATTSSRNSPARKSRASWRHASRHSDGDCNPAALDVEVFMAVTYLT